MEVRCHPYLSVLIFYLVWDNISLVSASVYARLTGELASWDSPVSNPHLVVILGHRHTLSCLALNGSQRFELGFLCLCDMSFTHWITSSATGLSNTALSFPDYMVLFQRRQNMFHWYIKTDTHLSSFHLSFKLFKAKSMSDSSLHSSSVVRMPWTE